MSADEGPFAGLKEPDQGLTLIMKGEFLAEFNSESTRFRFENSVNEIRNLWV